MESSNFLLPSATYVRFRDNQSLLEDKIVDIYKSCLTSPSSEYPTLIESIQSSLETALGLLEVQRQTLNAFAQKLMMKTATSRAKSKTFEYVAALKMKRSLQKCLQVQSSNQDNEEECNLEALEGDISRIDEFLVATYPETWSDSKQDALKEFHTCSTIEMSEESGSSLQSLQEEEEEDGSTPANRGISGSDPNISLIGSISSSLPNTPQQPPHFPVVEEPISTLKDEATTGSGKVEASPDVTPMISSHDHAKEVAPPNTPCSPPSHSCCPPPPCSAVMIPPAAVLGSPPHAVDAAPTALEDKSAPPPSPDLLTESAQLQFNRMLHLIFQGPRRRAPPCHGPYPSSWADSTPDSPVPRTVESPPSDSTESVAPRTPAPVPVPSPFPPVAMTVAPPVAEEALVPRTPHVVDVEARGGGGMEASPHPQDTQAEEVEDQERELPQRAQEWAEPRQEEGWVEATEEGSKRVDGSPVHPGPASTCAVSPSAAAAAEAEASLRSPEPQHTKRGGGEKALNLTLLMSPVPHCTPPSPPSPPFLTGGVGDRPPFPHHPFWLPKDNHSTSCYSPFSFASSPGRPAEGGGCGPSSASLGAGESEEAVTEGGKIGGTGAGVGGGGAVKSKDGARARVYGGEPRGETGDNSAEERMYSGAPSRWMSSTKPPPPAATGGAGKGGVFSGSPPSPYVTAMTERAMEEDGILGMGEETFEGGGAPSSLRPIDGAVRCGRSNSTLSGEGDLAPRQLWFDEEEVG